MTPPPAWVRVSSFASAPNGAPRPAWNPWRDACRTRTGCDRWARTCSGSGATDMTRALLITNPVAARPDARALTAVRETLRRGGWSVEVAATAVPGDTRRFAERGRVEGF